MLQHPLFYTFKNLRGNVRACVLTEPLWGIPFTLVIPYASVYMLALGLQDAQIGMIASLGMGIQGFMGLISGAITDKYGRRLTTALSDFFAWGIPAVIWAIAQDIRYFIVAAIFNAAWRISANSWTCLLVEDAEEDELVHIWVWIYIAGLLSAFFAPLAGVLVGVIDLIPAVRVMYWSAFVLMTIKAWLLYRYSTETRQGRIRMDKTRDQPLLSLLNGYGEVLKVILRTPQTLVVLGIWAVMSIYMLVNNTFWSILVTERLQIPPEHIAIYPFARSVLLLVLYFILVPRLNVRKFRNPMLIGFVGYILAQVILVIMPPGNYGLLLLSVMIEAFGIAMFRPLMDSLIILSIDNEERARINAILAVVIISITSPFGWIAGQLSEINRILPFVLNIGLFLIGAVLVVLAWRYSKPADAPQPEAVTL
ncbi:MAG: MFS transporter [Anaerolineales bacterium]|nr:MFS transporter [Anaerolineales bacterium]